MKKLGFIGFGEASINFASGVAGQVNDLKLFAYDTISGSVGANAKAYGLKVHSFDSIQELLLTVDSVIVAIPGNVDLTMIKGIEKQLFYGKLIMDFCTAKPKDKNEISKIIESVGGFYVDVAALGSFPALKHKVPMLISGNGVEKMMDECESFGMNIKSAGGKAGDAMIVKLCRSIYMKGLAALSIEMDKVSERYGVKDYVYSSLAESMDNDCFMVYTPRLINGTIKNLERRTKEVEECLELISNIGEDGIMTDATLHLYKNLN